MILSGLEIKKQVHLNRIHIFPFIEENINPNSYNYRLHEDLLEIVDYPLDARSKPAFRKVTISEMGFLLQPVVTITKIDPPSNH